MVCTQCRSLYGIHIAGAHVVNASVTDFHWIYCSVHLEVRQDLLLNLMKRGSVYTFCA